MTTNKETLVAKFRQMFKDDPNVLGVAEVAFMPITGPLEGEEYYERFTWVLPELLLAALACDGPDPVRCYICDAGFVRGCGPYLACSLRLEEHEFQAFICRLCFDEHGRQLGVEMLRKILDNDDVVALQIPLT
jgi:hypothetical protein